MAYDHLLFYKYAPPVSARFADLRSTTNSSLLLSLSTLLLKSMAVSSSRPSGPVLRPLSPSGRFSTSRYQAASPARSSTAGSPFASTTSTFSPRPPTFFNQSNSPAGAPLPKLSASAVRFSYDTSASPGGGRSIAAASPGNQAVQRQSGGQKRTCMCSPSTHPGSFRCSLHKSTIGAQQSRHGSAAPYQSNRLNARRSAMTNSLVRIGTVEGELVKRALSALIRPSSHNQRRRSGFKPRPSRLSTMSKAENS